jgi:pimeloyl-ACP methyl ester carboxylesterase
MLNTVYQQPTFHTDRAASKLTNDSTPARISLTSARISAHDKRCPCSLAWQVLSPEVREFQSNNVTTTSSPIMSLTHRFVEVNGDQVHVIETVPSTPSSSPPVILVSGLGTPGAHWCGVQRVLPPHIHSFAYDRLGTGQSDYPRTDSPRTAAILAVELKDTLTAAGLVPPYLFVASSYAGIICREYLEKYEGDVAGLIYVDANQEMSHIEREWPMEATAAMDTGGGLEGASGLSKGYGCSKADWEEIKDFEQAGKERMKTRPEGIPGEAASYITSLAALGKHDQLNRQSLGNRPLSVIVANLARDFERSYVAGEEAGLGSEEDHEAVEKFIKRLPGVEMRLAVNVLRLSSVHRLIYTSVSGHLVYIWEPELVVQEIMWCLKHVAR